MNKQYNFSNPYAAEQQQQRNALGMEFPLLMGNEFISPEEINVILGEKAAKRVCNWFNESVGISTEKLMQEINDEQDESVDGFIVCCHQAIGLGDAMYYVLAEEILEAVTNHEANVTMYTYCNIMDEYTAVFPLTYPEIIRHKTALGEAYNRFFGYRLHA